MAIPDWINVIPSSGNNSSTIDIVVDKNEGEERTYDLTVKDPGNPSLHKTISITLKNLNMKERFDVARTYNNGNSIAENNAT